jgi:hypothetical protein
MFYLATSGVMERAVWGRMALSHHSFLFLHQKYVLVRKEFATVSFSEEAGHVFSDL